MISIAWKCSSLWLISNKRRRGGGGKGRGGDELELRHGWLERQRGDISWLVVLISIDFDLGGAFEQDGSGACGTLQYVCGN